jgi:CBS domain-containing protein
MTAENAPRDLSARSALAARRYRMPFRLKAMCAFMRRAITEMNPRGGFCSAAELLFRCLGLCYRQSAIAMNASISTLLAYKGAKVFSVPSTTNVFDAVREMNRHNVSSILVMDGGRLMGLLTARDVLTRVIEPDLDVHATPVHRVMITDHPTLTPDMRAMEAMGIFERLHSSHLVVLEGSRVVGVISISDIASWSATAQRAESESMRAFLT